MRALARWSERARVPLTSGARRPAFGNGLGGQYPITAYYVNRGPASKPSPTTYKGVVCSTSLELGLLEL